MEPYITFKETTLSAGNQQEIADDIAALVQVMDQLPAALSPIREFGSEILARYYGQNLPDSQDLETPTQIHVSWPSDETPESADLCGLVGLELQYEQVITALASGKHVVLIGPPGTGKTELAECICSGLGIRFDLATATSDWSTFDTIGGYLPAPDASAGGSTGALDFQPGVVLQAMERLHWLIIDELNRADVDKAFGELFTLLGGGVAQVRLPFKKRHGAGFRDVVISQTQEGQENQYLYVMPENWRIMGTMNTFDKASLFQLSYAFMRRFAFVEIPIPSRIDYESILAASAQRLQGMGGSDAYRDACLGYLSALFAADDPTSLRGRGLPIGPAIPLDILGYLATRFPPPTPHSSADPVRDGILEALAIYLFPQFEGRSDKQTEIVDALTTALGTMPPASEEISRRLAIWTGYE